MTADDPNAPVMMYVTAADGAEARAIAEALVGERLVACANVFDGVSSFFRWEGDVQSEPEVAVVLKTRAGRVGAVTDRVKKLHSYSCPCVTVLPIAGGNADFLDWIIKETS
jgi:periplasmic divalent cation tolerance protein